MDPNQQPQPPQFQPPVEPPVQPQPQFEQPQPPVGVPSPAPAGVSQTGENPGQLFGILSIIMTVPLGLGIVGIILGILSRNKSKAVGASTTLGTVGLVLGIISVVLGIIFGAFLLIGIIAAANDPSMSTGSSSMYN